MDTLISSTLYDVLLIEMIPTTIATSKSQMLTTSQINLKLEVLGYKIGGKFNELLLLDLQDQFNNSNESLSNLLEIMKFICKDFWKVLFKKQISNLRTNHRGTFVLIDSNFKLFENFNPDDPNFQVTSEYYLHFINGIIRGVLKTFGVNTTITNELNFPSVTFNIETDQNN